MVASDVDPSEPSPTSQAKDSRQKRIDSLPTDTGPTREQAGYVVVARRYRPQTFDELVGQQHVARALTGAIAANRVGHAYLFCGARGVGKTSAARILAKALNCVTGPTPTPCNRCDICTSIGAGSDVDVLEIDGASNRGIDEIRQLRQNVNIRPSRASYKIYIIDEVHMLTREAFNALLKTLEEPPEHVKFIFCTTEATKIPVTILSRCQRFDFAGIGLASIVERLGQIAEAEGASVEPQALALLARRAAGSMRDSQSLLEQLLAFGGQRITAADVHAMLGTAGEARLSELADRLIHHHAGASISLLDAAIAEGVDVGPLLEQLLGYFRDVLAAALGCSAESALYTAPDQFSRLTETGKQLGVETILAVMQILDHTLSRLRYSTQSRTLAEMALVRIASLENLDELADLVSGLRDGSAPANAAPSPPTPDTAKKKADLSAAPHLSPPPLKDAQSQRETRPLTPETVESVWKDALALIDGLLVGQAGLRDTVSAVASDRLAVVFREKYTSCKDFCERPDQLARLEAALAQVVGGRVSIEFAVVKDESSPTPAPKVQATRTRTSTEHPLVRRAGQLFDARVVRVEAGREPQAD